jgi:hypothetical protein
VAEEKKERFVVLHTGVDDWRAGDVIDRDALFIRNDKGQVIVDEYTKQPADRLERLQRLGAIRPAADVEHDMARVTLPAPGFSPAQQLRLATLDATVEQLTVAVAAHEERAAAHARLRGVVAPLPGPEEDPTFDLAVKEREARVEGLRQRLAAAQEQAQEHLESLQAASEARAREIPEGMPTGQAIPTGGDREDPSGQEEQQQQAQQEQAQQEAANRRAEAQRQRREREAREKQQQ